MTVNDIIVAMFDFLFKIIDGLKIPEFTIDFSVMETFLDAVSTAAYFFPVAYVTPIVGFLIMLQIFRVALALLKFVVHFLPGF